jgi:hypothetical protein
MIGVWSNNALHAYANAMTEPEREKENRVTLKHPNPKLFAISNGTLVQAVEALFVIDYNVSVEFVPFSFRTYLDVGKRKQVTQAAVCAVKIGKVTTDVVFSKNEKGEINLADLVPGQPSEIEGKPK